MARSRPWSDANPDLRRHLGLSSLKLTPMGLAPLPDNN
jgi:hypothetical protein